MEALENIKISRKEYERLMRTLKRLGLDPNAKYKITERGKEHLKHLKDIVNSYDYSLFGRRRTHTARKEEIRAKVLDILEKVGPTNLLDLKFYLNKNGRRLYYSYVAEMVDEKLIAQIYDSCRSNNVFYF
jgi:hypothetical protein